MGNLKAINCNERYDYFYVTINVPINNEMKHCTCIFERSKDEVHPFTSYLKDKMGSFTLKDKSLNTIKNFHLTFIIRFLNFIFNDSEAPINKIEDLTLKIVEEFLDKFSSGTLPNDVSQEWKSKKSVGRANYTISHFVYWLWWKKEPNSYKKMFKMTHIKENIFEFETVTKRSKDGYSTKEVKRLMPIVIPTVSSRVRTRAKVVDASNYSVAKLLELSQENDNMLTFGIALGSYLGLRVGDIAQMHEGRIKGLCEGKLFGAYFDLTYDAILRSDNLITGNIKTKRNVPVYAGCAKALFIYYENHINYLRYKGLYPNKYGALFIDNNGYAMTLKTYLRRFNDLNNLLDSAIKVEVSLGNEDAIQEEQILSNNKITPHSLRHYYKQLIETVEPNKRIVQYYMAHKSIDSQESYAYAKSTKEGIRACQNQVYSQVKGTMFNK
jgi:integrase